MVQRTLCAEEQRSSGYTDVIEIGVADLVAFGGVTTGVIPILVGLQAGDIIKDVDFNLITPFSGGAGTALKLNVGINGATIDSNNCFVNNIEVNSAGAEVLAGDGNGGAFATLRTGWAMVETGQVEAMFTATGANLNTLTAGLVQILVKKVRMGNYRV